MSSRPNDQRAIPLNLYSRYIKSKYGSRVQKISIDAGFTCPNRDGTKGLGGCTFCNNDSFSSGDNNLTIKEQVLKGINQYQKRFPSLNKFIVYFQSYSNTYKPLHELKKMYLEALQVGGVVGLAIGTRPDCIDEDKIKFLEELAIQWEITIEYGIESFNDTTLLKINRGHTVKDFEKALELTVGRGIGICTHLILGFPWENENDFTNTLHAVSSYPLDFIKVHQLQVVKGTVMGHDYVKSPFHTLTKDEYFQKLKMLICHLPENVVIQRLFSQYNQEFLLSPGWDASLSSLTTEFLGLLQREGLSQGKFCRFSKT